MTNRCTDTASRAAIYRKAAQLIERGKLGDSGRGSCSAITQVSLPKIHHGLAYEKLHNDDIVTGYAFLFAPGGATVGYWGTMWGVLDKDQDDCRILALCFMAAMVEAGDA